MKLLGLIIGLVVLFVLAAVLYPLAAPYLDNGRRDANQQILRFHSAANAPKRNKQLPLLYLSESPKENPKHADDSILYFDGRLQERRVLWNNAVQGGGGQMKNTTALQALKTLPPLLPGLSTPENVEYKNLLIVSQQVNGQWKTYYYDRTRLPVPVQKMQALITAASR